MSETYFYIVPVDQNFVPEQELQTAALELLNEVLPFPEGDMNDIRVFDKPEFINSGEYLDSVICPNCNAMLRIGYREPYEKWWELVCEKIWRADLDAIIAVPCCNATTRVGNLRFDGASGFARFALEAEPCFETEVWEGFYLRQSVIERFEILLGCKVLQIVQRC